MCGICYIYNLKNNHVDNSDLTNLIKSRGPDLFMTKKININDNKQIIMHCAVLHFQGKNIQEQPIYDKNKEISSILAWNGEVFISQLNLEEYSDSIVMYNTISTIETNSNKDDFITNIIKFLETIGGPYSIIYYSSKFNITFFARDPIGRRSLLIGKNDDEIVITSIGCSNDKIKFSEISVDGVYVIDNNSVNDNISINLYPWISRHNNHPVINKINKHLLINDNKKYSLSMLSNVISYFDYKFNNEIDTPNIQLAKEYLFTLAKSLYRRISFDTRQGDKKSQPIMILFSGGIDSTVLAALSHILLSNNEDELKIPFELVNISSGKNPSESPDRLASIFAFNEIKKLPYAEKRDFRLIFVDVTDDNIKQNEKHISKLIYPKNTVMDFNIGTALWFATQQFGKLSNLCNNNDLDEIISYFSSRPIPQLKQKRTNNDTCENEKYDNIMKIIMNEIISQEKVLFNDEDNLYYILLSSLSGNYEQLQKEITKNNCKTLSELINKCQKENYIKTHGHNESFMIAIIKNEYKIKIDEEMKIKKQLLLKLTAKYGVEYDTKSRIVILGMGADESLGGYSRYKTQNYSNEMQLDFSRLWERNLGRDDRIISDSGREARFPFLDEDVLHLLSCCEKSCDIFDFSKPIGIGDKMILRTCARMIGLNSTSFLAKRAIQFGTRIANRKNAGKNSFDSQKL
jgi:asparagine synthetase B (glutamine-hydrolysing)